MPPRPVKLTVVSIDVGMAEVRANGVLAGIATADHWWRWTARLLAVAGQRNGGDAGEVTRDSLRELRAALRERLASEGPWWGTAASPAQGAPRA